MQSNKNENKAISLTVTEGLTVTIQPSSDHEFLMDSKQVALGYGVSYGNIREHKRVNDEFVEGKHFISGVRFSDSDPCNKVYWTKRGVVRLGFFIKSERAKMFRDWAEDLILQLDEQMTLFPLEKNKNLKLSGKRNHNRLTQDRLISILADVCRIDDKQLRLSITSKLMEGGSHGN